MISAQQLSKSYGDKRALHQLDLEIAPGEVFCLLGQNGAGKTTTIQCFLGFIQPSSGKALINGMEVAANPVATKKYLAYLPEVVMLYPNLSGMENLDYFSRLAGFRYKKADLRLHLELAGLDGNDWDRRVSTYSKGMRQKVGIAIAIAKNAKALFLDEPTSGLDPKAANDLNRLLSELKNNGVAILMATHDIFRAKDIADRIGIMKQGQLVNTLDSRHQDLLAKEIEAIYLQTI